MTPGQPSGDKRTGCGPVLLGCLVAAGVWAYLLHGFVPTRILVTLTIGGPALALGGACLSAAGFRHALSSVWYFGAFVTGLLLLAGGALTLAPQAPAWLLVTTTAGWSILDWRLERVQTALDDGDLALVRRLANRGLGDPAPAGRGGEPLIHGVREIDRLEALLAAGLDPDARDDEGRTLLFKTWDEAIARAVIGAGADPNARDADGATPLMAAGERPLEIVQLLLDAGADVHAADDRGRTVADALGDTGPIRDLLDAHAGGRPLRTGRATQPLDPGRTDWLVPGGPAARPGGSAIALDRPVRRGAVATFEMRLVNDTDGDRLLDVRAHLNEAALFVQASHDGAIESPRRLASWQTVRWPPLAMPARSEGRLSLDVLPRAEGETGDLTVDVLVHDRISQAEDVLQASEPHSRADVAGGAAIPALAVPLGIAGGLGLTIWRMLRRRRNAIADRQRAAARTAAAIASLICAALAIVLVAQAVEPFVRFEETRCTVLDRRALTRTSEPAMVRSMADRRRLGRSLPSRERAFRYEVPLVAVRLERAEGPIVASGFTTGMATRSVHELRDFPIGATTSCWVDPNDAATFTLIRSPAPSAVAGISILTMVALVLGTAARHPSRRTHEPMNP